MNLKTPQARCLDVLKDGAALTRAELGRRAGFTPLSGTPTRALNGIREGSSSGAAHPGLLALGYVEALELDDDGVIELCYRITPAGQAALAEWLESNEIPAVKSAARATNKRYKE